MARLGRIVAIALAGVLVAATAVAEAGEAAAKPKAKPKPERPQHTPKRMLGKSSVTLKKRPWYKHALLYLPSRMLDMVDCLGFEVAAGEGLHANVRATRLLQLGYGRQESTRAGLNSRHIGIVDEELKEKALGWWWELDLRRYNLRGTSANLDISEADVRARYYKEADRTGVGISVFVGIFGVSAELRPRELLDLIQGFATLDPLEDEL